MPRCSRCGEEDRAIYIAYMRSYLCPECFLKFYERKVKNTVLKHGMFRGAVKVGVAVSGGKDSMALLRAIRNIFPDLELTAIHINLGIGEYSNECERKVRELCEELGVELVIHRLAEEEGFTIPDLLNTPYGRRICGACGIVKRYLMNRMGWELGVDRLATGHNLDDTVELLFELYLTGRVEELVRVRPVLEGGWRIVARVKPLIEMTEEENLWYARLTNTSFATLECPLVKGSRMIERKKLIARIEEEIPGFRHLLYKSHVKRLLPRLEKVVEKPELKPCELCGMPATGKICGYCRLVSRVLKAVKAHGKAGG